MACGWDRRVPDDVQMEEILSGVERGMAVGSDLQNDFSKLSEEEVAALPDGRRPITDVAPNMLIEGNETQLELGIDAINQIGHTSGWDALAGVAVVLHQLASTFRSM